MLRRNLVNIFSLASVQGANALLPIFIFPYVLHMFGAEKYTSLVVGEAISLIVLAVVIYSYEINGVSKVVNCLKSDGLTSASAVFSEVFCCRLFIWVICLIIVLGAGAFIQPELFLALLCWMLVPLAYVFQSAYFFQALEKNLPVAIFTVISRVVCCLIVFFWLKPIHPFFLLPLIVGGGYLVGGVCAWIYLLSVAGVKFKRISWICLLDSLQEGKEIFFGNFAVVLFRDSNVLVLSFFGISAATISSYSVVEKFIKAFQAIVRPLNQFFFPRVIHAVHGRLGPDRVALSRIVRLTYLQLVVLFCILLCFIGLWAGLKDRVEFLASYPNKILMQSLFIFMSIGVFFGISNFMFGTAGLNALGAKNYLAKSLVCTGVVTLALCVISTKVIGVYGAAGSFVFGEVMLFTLIMHKYSRGN